MLFDVGDFREKTKNLRTGLIPNSPSVNSNTIKNIGFNNDLSKYNYSSNSFDNSTQSALETSNQMGGLMGESGGGYSMAGMAMQGIQTALSLYTNYKNYKDTNANLKVNYDLLNQQELFKYEQANTFEIEAQEQINSAREKLNKDIGNLIFSATRRGVKTTSGTISNNIEMSSKNLSQDETKIMKQANRQAEQYRLSALSGMAQNRANYLNQKASNKFNYTMGTIQQGLNMGAGLVSFIGLL